MIATLSKFRADFFFVERDGIAYHGTQELIASVAKWLRPGDPFAAVPEILPYWLGSYLPFEAALRRWAFPDVHVVRIGVPTAALRKGLVHHVRDQPPLGMFDSDADAGEPELPLVLHGFILPQAALERGVEGRRIDRKTGLDMIGFSSEEESLAFDWLEENSFDPLGVSARDLLLRAVVRGAGRRLPGVRGTDGYDALVDHAFELFWMGAAGAAGAVAGTAFETLMQAALEGADLQWLRGLQSTGKHIKLDTVISKVIASHAIDGSRLRAYQRLRNDLAHRLGDDSSSVRTEVDIAELVRDFLWWLNDQKVDEAGTAVLKRTDPDPVLTHDQLYEIASNAGARAAANTQTTPIRIGSDRFEPFGHAWVTVRDRESALGRWLTEEKAAHATDTGVELYGPESSFERNLAWAHAFCSELRDRSIDASYAGRPN